MPYLYIIALFWLWFIRLAGSVTVTHELAGKRWAPSHSRSRGGRYSLPAELLTRTVTTVASVEAAAEAVGFWPRYVGGNLHPPDAPASTVVEHLPPSPVAASALRVQHLFSQGALFRGARHRRHLSRSRSRRRLHQEALDLEGAEG